MRLLCLGWIVKPLMETVLIQNLQDLQDHNAQFLLERKNGEIQRCQIRLDLLIQIKVMPFFNYIIAKNYLLESEFLLEFLKHSHTSSVKRFSENFDHKAVTYLIFFVGTHWFQKCNFWKNSLSPFWGRWGQTTSKIKLTKILNENPLKIDEIQNLASPTS